MTTGATPRRKVSREAILDAAAGRFFAYGFARTSMEDIARAAGISRPALYLRFDGKEDIFRANTERIHEACLVDAAAAAGAGGPLAARLEGVLRAKLDAGRKVLAVPHGAELLDEESRLAGDISREAHRRYVALVRGLLDEAAARGEIDPARSGLTTSAAAALIDTWAQGMKQEIGLGTRAYRRRVATAAAFFARGLAA